MAKPGRKKKVAFDPEQQTEHPADEAPPPLPIPEQQIEAQKPEKPDQNGSFLPKKDLFRVDEVARHLDISERCVRLWLDHGHLEGVRIVGSIRITRLSIISCIKKYVPKKMEAGQKLS